jgi:hypothetical protein
MASEGLHNVTIFMRAEAPHDDVARAHNVEVD